MRTWPKDLRRLIVLLLGVHQDWSKGVTSRQRLAIDTERLLMLGGHGVGDALFGALFEAVGVFSRGGLGDVEVVAESSS
jgi:hypothetical protein